jgi:arsenate reductase
MAMAILNHFYGGEFEAESAGFEAGKLNPLAVEAMKQAGIDISGNPTNKVFDYVVQGRIYNYVITVCDEASAQRCPVFVGVTSRLHWSFEDPSEFTGTYGEKLAKTIQVRDEIKNKIDSWVKLLIEKTSA